MPDVPALASYAIDADGRIAWVDDGFAALAEEHGVPELADGVVGRPLLDFVAGDRPRALQRSLLERGVPRELRYRCDGPAMRRHAILRLEPRDDGGMTFTTRFEETEPRPYEALLDVRHERSDEVIRLCAWCNRIDAGGWREIDGDGTPRIDHTVCEVCEMLLTRPAAGPR